MVFIFYIFVNHNLDLSASPLRIVTVGRPLIVDYFLYDEGLPLVITKTIGHEIQNVADIINIGLSISFFQSY